jgi:hypothetical protein
MNIQALALWRNSEIVGLNCCRVKKNKWMAYPAAQFLTAGRK